MNSSKVVFFFGAGASVAAGVPDTNTFVTDYLKKIRGTNKETTVKKIIDTLEQWKGHSIDIELLLETLTKLRDKKDDPLLQFFPEPSSIVAELDEKDPVIDSLKDFIKKKAIVSEKKIQYLQSLLPIIEEYKPLDIISVNYDTSVEQFCNVQKLTYEDGFDVHWNSQSFEKENTDIRLYKIHGSVMWYQTDHGDYVKLPVMTGEHKVQLITGEKAINLMLYPMQKWNYAEPFLELSVRVKHLLELDSCKFLIVVGYSFRDEHIIKILWDSARTNRNLRVILIDPNAYKIYKNKLQYYDSSHTNPSSLYGKVICLPYLFEKISPLIKNYFLKNLEIGLSAEALQHKEEISGNPPTWDYCAIHFIAAEYIDKAEEMVHKSQLSSNNLRNFIEAKVKMAINLSIGGEEERSEKIFKKFIKIIQDIAVDRLYARYESVWDNQRITAPAKHILRIGVGSVQVDNTYSPKMWGEQFIDVITDLYDYTLQRISYSTGESPQVQSYLTILQKLKDHFHQYEKGTVSLENYIRNWEIDIDKSNIVQNAVNGKVKSQLPNENEKSFTKLVIQREGFQEYFNKIRTAPLSDEDMKAFERLFVQIESGRIAALLR